MKNLSPKGMALNFINEFIETRSLESFSNYVEMCTEIGVELNNTNKTPQGRSSLDDIKFHLEVLLVMGGEQMYAFNYPNAAMHLAYVHKFFKLNDWDLMSRMSPTQLFNPHVYYMGNPKSMKEDYCNYIKSLHNIVNTLGESMGLKFPELEYGQHNKGWYHEFNENLRLTIHELDFQLTLNSTLEDNYAKAVSYMHYDVANFIPQCITTLFLHAGISLDRMREIRRLVLNKLSK